MSTRFPFFIITVAITFFFSNAATAGLTHRYSFNDGTANDSVGHANGALMNGATVGGGQLLFDPGINNGSNNPSTGQFVNLPSNILFTRSLPKRGPQKIHPHPGSAFLTLGTPRAAGFSSWSRSIRWNTRSDRSRSSITADHPTPISSPTAIPFHSELKLFMRMFMT